MNNKYYVHIGTIAERVVTNLLGHATHEEGSAGHGKSSAITTGYAQLDSLMGGLRGGSMYLIGGRPGMGKAAFALNVALNILETSRPVYYFSPELSPEEIVHRLISIMTGVESLSFRLKNLSDKEKTAVNAALSRLKAMPLYICHTPFPEAEDLAAMIRTADKDGVAIIDDVQSVCWNKSRPFMRGFMDHDGISKVSRELKLAAIEAGIPLVCTTRLTRNLELRRDKHPILSDLEESAGVLEYDADGVIFIYRDAYYCESHDHGKAELILAKNRWGSTGNVQVKFDFASCRFSNIA